MPLDLLWARELLACSSAWAIICSALILLASLSACTMAPALRLQQTLKLTPTSRTVTVRPSLPQQWPELAGAACVPTRACEVAINVLMLIAQQANSQIQLQGWQR